MPPTNKTKAVARIAAKKGVSRKAANTIRKQRKTTRATAVKAFEGKYGKDMWTTGGASGRVRIGKTILKEQKRAAQASMKGKSSKKAVKRATKKVTARSGMTGKAATRQARRIVRGRKAKK